MRALTLRQPWPWIMLHLGKRLENRAQNIGNYRGPLALHAGLSDTEVEWEVAADFVEQRVGREAAQALWSRCPGFGKKRTGHPEVQYGVIFAVTSVVDQFGPEWVCDKYPALLADAPERVREMKAWVEQRKWYMGEHAYLLDELRPVPPVSCRGLQGFWPVPAPIAAQVDAALGAA